MTKPLFTVEYQLDRSEQKLLALQFSKLVIKGKFFLGYLGVLLVLAGLMVYSSYQDGYTWTASLLPALPLALAIPAFLVLGYFVNRRRLKQLAKKFPTFRYEFYDTYLVNRTQSSESKLNYNILDKIFSTKAGTFIKFTHQYYFLPAAQVTPELVAFLQSRIKS